MTSLKQQLITSLGAIEGFEARPSAVAGGTALFYRGREFAHFHHDQEIDVRMTRPLIKSFGLKHPERSALHPTRAASSHWIELRYATADEVARVAELIKAAIREL